MIRLGIGLLFLLGLTAEGWAQQQRRLCFSVTGAPFCTVVTSTNKMPVGTGTGGAGTGTAGQIRLCYAIPGSPFCQVVDALHPLPVQ